MGSPQWKSYATGDFKVRVRHLQTSKEEICDWIFHRGSVHFYNVNIVRVMQQLHGHKEFGKRERVRRESSS